MTSIEWLIDQLEKKGDMRETASIRNLQLNIDTSDYLELKRQAKEMHKQEMQNNIVEATKMITDFEIKIIAQQEATFAPSFVRGVEWYREQLKQRQ